MGYRMAFLNKPAEKFCFKIVLTSEKIWNRQVCLACVVSYEASHSLSYQISLAVPSLAGSKVHNWQNVVPSWTMTKERYRRIWNVILYLKDEQIHVGPHCLRLENLKTPLDFGRDFCHKKLTPCDILRFDAPIQGCTSVYMVQKDFWEPGSPQILHPLLAAQQMPTALNMCHPALQPIPAAQFCTWRTSLTFPVHTTSQNVN